MFNKPQNRLRSILLDQLKKEFETNFRVKSTRKTRNRLDIILDEPMNRVIESHCNTVVLIYDVVFGISNEKSNQSTISFQL